MGTPKALHPLRGRPLLAYALDTLAAIGLREIIVVLGAEAERVREAIRLEGIHVIVNSRFADGMSTSIRAGWRAVSPESKAVLIFLGDQPFVVPATVAALVARRSTTSARILVPTYAGVRGNPVLLDRAFASEVDALRGDVGCRGIAARHARQVVEVAVEDPGILLDLDTPEDFQRLEAALVSSQPLAGLVADRVAGAGRRTRPRPRT